MKLLVDANLSPRVAARLATAGYDTAHVSDHGLLAASDEAIAAFAVDNGMIIVSADTDFATMLALSGQVSPSLILLRSGDALSPSEQAALIVNNLPTVADALSQGAVVSLSRRHLRCGVYRYGRAERSPRLQEGLVTAGSWCAMR